MKIQRGQCKGGLCNPTADNVVSGGELNELPYLFEQHLAYLLPYSTVAYLMVEALFRVRKYPKRFCTSEWARVYLTSFQNSETYAAS